MRTQEEIQQALDKALENYRELSMEVSIEYARGGFCDYDAVDYFKTERNIVSREIDLLCWILDKDAKELIDLVMHRPLNRF